MENSLDDALDEIFDETADGTPDEDALVNPTADESAGVESPEQAKEKARAGKPPVRTRARGRRKTSAMPYVIGGAVVVAAVAVGALVFRGRRPSRPGAGRPRGGSRAG